MSIITWGQFEDVSYEHGISKGVLYGDSGLFSPWNGLSSVDENISNSGFESVFFDSRKIFTSATTGVYEISVKSYSFPNSFSEYLGIKSERSGIFVTNQNLKVFNFTYQTKIDNENYQIHLLEKVVSEQTSVSNATVSDAYSPNLFSFNLRPTSIKTLNNSKPSSHIIIDAEKVSSNFLSFVEDRLYGTETSNPQFVTKLDIMTFM